MKTIGIMIDDWKLPIFKKTLNKAGYSFKKHEGLTPDTFLLKIDVESIAKLEPVVVAANKAAAKYKRQKKH